MHCDLYKSCGNLASKNQNQHRPSVCDFRAGIMSSRSKRERTLNFSFFVNNLVSQNPMFPANCKLPAREFFSETGDDFADREDDFPNEEQLEKFVFDSAPLTLLPWQGALRLPSDEFADEFDNQESLSSFQEDPLACTSRTNTSTPSLPCTENP